MADQNCAQYPACGLSTRLYISTDILVLVCFLVQFRIAVSFHYQVDGSVFANKADSLFVSNWEAPR